MKKYFILILILSSLVGVAQTDTHVLINYDTIPCDTTLRQVTINIVDSSFQCPTNYYFFYVDTSSVLYTPPVIIPLDTGKHVLIIGDCTGYIFSDSIFINCGTVTLIDNLNSFNLEIISYPNPVHNYLYIENRKFQNVKNVEVSIYNIQGRKLKQGKIASMYATIDVSDLTKGLYILKIYFDNKIYIKKFVKE